MTKELFETDTGPTPRRRELISLPPSQRPILTVVVDTEEEFDWNAGFDRESTGVQAMRDIGRIQEVFDEFGIVPTYVADYPVVTQPDGLQPLKEFRDSGRAAVGAHLHPWVTPPFEEEVCPSNSYPGNLPRELEAAKLRELVSVIETNLGFRPTIYKAGRHGFGPNTVEILEEAGFKIDLSLLPRFNMGEDGGPDYSGFTDDPFWFGRDGDMLGLPTTGAYVGFLGKRAHGLFKFAGRSSVRWARMRGVFSRLRAVDRLILSPEGYDPSDHRRLTQYKLARGARVFSFTFHSPSVTPGCTPYVLTKQDLTAFLDSCRRYFEFFLGEVGGVSMEPTQVRDLMLAQQTKATA